ncbi:DoxX family protein [Candidatus Woesearchaeota archaeon]|nr:DoxX family protein [Candidatus Woesearchaeota archaeon]
MLAKVFKGSADYAPLVLRLALALVFIAHGYQKLFVMGVGAVAEMFAGLGIPLASVSAWVVALVEFVGGICLLLGLLTRYAALLISIVMVVAILKVKLAVGLIAPMGTPMPGAELDVALLAAAVSIVLAGPGKWALERTLFKQEL